MVSTETKLELLRRLANTGVRNMEAGAFVSPKHVPQVPFLNLALAIMTADLTIECR